MTKRREPLTYHRALTTIAASIGWDRCAAICGVGERMVRYWSDPDCETEIRMLDAERLDKAFLAAGGDHAPFHRTFALRLEIEARESDASLTALAASSAKETGEAVAAMIAASDGSPEARRTARREVQQAIEILTDGLATLAERDSADRDRANRDRANRDRGD
jgi:hypothetical protein